MCGIFGFGVSDASLVSFDETRNVVRSLLRYSESRGKESTGLALHRYDAEKIFIYKENISATALIAKKGHTTFLRKALEDVSPRKRESPKAFGLIGHTRLVTNGSHLNHSNNQPTAHSGTITVHNGIVTNIETLWKKYGNTLERHAEVDTEIISALVGYGVAKGESPIRAVQNVFREIQGTASFAILSDAFPDLLLATNTGSLYYTWLLGLGVFLFSSERYILSRVLRTLPKSIRDHGNGCPIRQLPPFFGMWVHIPSMKHGGFDLRAVQDSEVQKFYPPSIRTVIQDVSPSCNYVPCSIPVSRTSGDEKLLVYPEAELRALYRCSRCVLPETFPFIDFDEMGVCNYCRGYVPRCSVNRIGELESIVAPYRNSESVDCIVALSGGRDSSYGLHFVKRELGLNPIAFTYDWGMVTDLARRNIARLCGKLGVEHILVSADIAQKRDYIRKNLTAWLQNPDLGIIPLLMAGDKHFFYYMNQVKKRTGLRLNIWSVNYLENTDFKVGFCGVPPHFRKRGVEKLTLRNKFWLSSYYFGHYFLNPRYINASVWDTLWAFHSYYFERRKDFYRLYDYVVWNEDTILSLLRSEYDWELSPDTVSTWRIGDGTAAFYNYVYTTVAGFSECDTFRSNQIREGMIDRQTALRQILEENRPAYGALKWYLDTVGVDFADTIRTINRIPRLYDVGAEAGEGPVVGVQGL